MFDRLTGDARRVVARAASQEAQALGATSVEAEHVLLALAADESRPAGRLLVETRLDHDRLGGALERETELSLAAVGIALTDFSVSPTPRPPRGNPRFGASAKRAMHRAVVAAGERKDSRITSSHLLVGILGADIGTVPRALAAAEVDRVALLERAQALLGSG
jgi:ATP-dependent Clp protease ATP-binding subunit ClpA